MNHSANMRQIIYGGILIFMMFGHEKFFLLNRDYFLQEMPGYTPYAYPHPLAGN